MLYPVPLEVCSTYVPAILDIVGVALALATDKAKIAMSIKLRSFHTLTFMFIPYCFFGSTLLIRALTRSVCFNKIQKALLEKPEVALLLC